MVLAKSLSLYPSNQLVSSCTKIPVPSISTSVTPLFLSLSHLLPHLLLCPCPSRLLVSGSVPVDSLALASPRLSWDPVSLSQQTHISQASPTHPHITLALSLACLHQVPPQSPSRLCFHPNHRPVRLYHPRLTPHRCLCCRPVLIIRSPIHFCLSNCSDFFLSVPTPSPSLIRQEGRT